VLRPAFEVDSRNRIKMASLATFSRCDQGDARVCLKKEVFMNQYLVPPLSESPALSHDCPLIGAGNPFRNQQYWLRRPLAM